MADSVRVTPASRKIEFFNPTTASAKSTISLDTSGNLTIVADGTIDIGDTSADIYVGDGSSNVDIVYTADGEIRTEGSGVELSLVSAETMSAKVPLLHISDTGTEHKTLLKLDNGVDTNGAKGVGMDFRVRFGSTNIHTSQIYFDFYGDKWTNSIGMNYVSGRSGSFSHHYFREQGGGVQMMIADDGQVGIGSSFTHAAQPDDLLHLKGTDAALLVEDAGSNSNPAVEIKNDAVHWKLQARGGDSDKLRIVEGNNVHMVVKTDGNVGIGTTTPQWGLSVPGDVTIGWYNNFTGTNTGTGAADATLRVAGRAFDKPAIIELANFDANNYYGGTTSFLLGRIGFAMNENSNTVTQVASIEAMTEDPSEEGHFDGRLLFNTSAGDASGANLTTKLVIDGNGFVGIGTTSPDGILDVSSASTINVYYTKTATPCTLHTQVQTSAVIMGTTTNHNLQFKANGGVRMTLQPGGNVGINDTTPSYKLDVNGTGRFTGALTGNATVVSDGAGDGVVTLGETDGVFIQEFVVADGSTPTDALYSNVNQKMAATITRGNRVTTSGSGTNSGTVLTSTTSKYYLFNVVMDNISGSNVADTFQSFDVTIYIGDDTYNTSRRKTLHCMHDGSTSNLFFSAANNIQNVASQTLDYIDIGVEYATGDATITGVASDNIAVARFYITLPRTDNLGTDRFGATHLNWSWEFTGLRDEATNA